MVVTKTALLGLTMALAVATELATHTRVNCVASGFVPTHFASYITNNETIVSVLVPLKILINLQKEIR
ncbi:putative NAD(P)-binding domain superfamily [Helianthus debilis subsp. tardiflorus]